MCRPGRRSVPSLSQHVKTLIYNISLHNRVTSFLTQWTVQISRPTNIPKGTFLYSTIVISLQTQHSTGHFYILPFYKLQSDQSTDLLPPQKTFLLSNHPNHYKSTILPNQSGDSNIPTIQTTDPKIISRQPYHTKVKIPTFLPFQPLQTYHSTKLDISTFLLSKSTDSKVIS